MHLIIVISTKIRLNLSLYDRFRTKRISVRFEINRKLPCASSKHELEFGFWSYLQEKCRTVWSILIAIHSTAGSVWSSKNYAKKCMGCKNCTGQKYSCLRDCSLSASRGAKLRDPLNPSSTIVLGWSEGFERCPIFAPYETPIAIHQIATVFLNWLSVGAFCFVNLFNIDNGFNIYNNKIATLFTLTYSDL